MAYRSYVDPTSEVPKGHLRIIRILLAWGRTRDEDDNPIADVTVFLTRGTVDRQYRLIDQAGDTGWVDSTQSQIKSRIESWFYDRNDRR